MRARTNIVLPAPRSPDSVTRSPGSSELAMSTASRWVACSSGSTIEKLEVTLEVPDGVSSIDMGEPLPEAGRPARAMLRRRPLGLPVEREDAGHGGAAPDRGFERHRAAVQLDEGAHQREAEAGAAVAGAERMGL